MRSILDTFCRMIQGFSALKMQMDATVVFHAQHALINKMA